MLSVEEEINKRNFREFFEITTISYPIEIWILPNSPLTDDEQVVEKDATEHLKTEGEVKLNCLIRWGYGILHQQTVSCVSGSGHLGRIYQVFVMKREE